MPDERRAQGPKPVLRTRPATMLTAIGLCVLIMVIQLVPQIRDIGASRIPASTDGRRAIILPTTPGRLCVRPGTRI